MAGKLPAIRAVQETVRDLWKQWEFPLVNWTHNALLLTQNALDLQVANHISDDTSQSQALSHIPLTFPQPAV